MRFYALDLDALEFRSLFPRLALHSWAEIIAGYSVREAREVFNLLNADQMSARDIGFQNQRGKAMARGEQPGSQATEPRANDYYVVVCHV